MGNMINKTGPLPSNIPVPSAQPPVAPKAPGKNVDSAAKSVEASAVKTADELLKKNVIKQSEGPVNELSFPSKDGGSKTTTKQEKIDKLSTSIQNSAEILKKKLSDNGANDLNDTMGVIMKEAKNSLSSEDFGKLNNKLFPMSKADQPKADQYKKMISDAIETFKGSDQPEAAMDNLLKYLSTGTVNIVEDNPGC